MSELETFAARLQGDAPLQDEVLYLAPEGCRMSLRSNSAELIARLAGYFAHVTASAGAVDMEIVAIEGDPPEMGVEFLDWAREPGKTGRKDSYHDFHGGRLVRKVRTGMVFLQSDTRRMAAGPCVQNDNQVINFINSQYMNWLQQRGWLICHAAGLVRGGRALGIAGFSGGGKSTLMLHMLEDGQTAYLTNDRLFIRHEADDVHAAGIPKLPRVNPGTVVNNPRLQPLIDELRRSELLAMPKDELWELEEKYDVPVDRLYGAERILQRAPMSAFLILNWQRDSDQPFRLQQVDIARRRDLLAAVMKSPGPFYQSASGAFIQADTPFDEQAYVDMLSPLKVYEASGRLDFSAVLEKVSELMG